MIEKLKEKIEAKECGHKRTLKVSAKSVDACWVRWPNGEESDGYAPNIPGIGGGDYIEIEACLDCGHLVGFPTGNDDAILVEQPEEKPKTKAPHGVYYDRQRASEFVEACQVCGGEDPDCP